MENKEVYEFCEDNAITISKFLQDNFEVEIYPSKTERKKKKNRIKHDGIKGMLNVIMVPKSFAYRYKELVRMGKIIVVRDDFGEYQAYINPRVIAYCCNYNGLDNFYYDNLEIVLKKVLDNYVEDMRLINHFSGNETFGKSRRLYSTYDELEKKENNKVVRKRVESSSKI